MAKGMQPKVKAYHEVFCVVTFLGKYQIPCHYCTGHLSKGQITGGKKLFSWKKI